MNRRQMLREILEYDNSDQAEWECPLGDGPIESSYKGEPIWPEYCSVYTHYGYEGTESDCFGSNGRYTCDVMQAIRFATGNEKRRLWQLSKAQLTDIHAQLID